MYRILILLCLLTLTTLGAAPNENYAQSECGFADRVIFPVDIDNAYAMAQAYSVPSPRHHGRYHTGEDWHIGRGQTIGQPVNAIANGRVTYSYPLGWGRDGGVVIIEHTFTDGTVVYSQYGHMMETDSITFPRRLSCVEIGDVIGAVGDSRPAPHLHLEIRVSMADTPGPGYSWSDPHGEGWRHPSQFIRNRQAWSDPAHRWHLQTVSPRGFTAPPLRLNDNSLMYIDGRTLRLATFDGRVLWRVILNDPAVAVTGFEAAPLVFYADGRVQQVDFEGTPVNSWTLDAQFDSPAYPAGDRLLFRTADDALVAISSNRREIDWRIENVPRFSRLSVAGSLIALLSATNELWLIDPEGGLLDRAQLRARGSLGTAADGTLLVYSVGGLWQVDEAAVWSPMIPAARALNNSSAILALDDGSIAAYDGESLHRYTTAGETLWSLPLGASGIATLTQEDNMLTLVSNEGHIMVADLDGTLCYAMQVYGDGTANIWNELGPDSVLRVGVDNQIIGLDWAEITRRCTRQ